jgi:PAS domain S-box-containing protein
MQGILLPALYIFAGACLYAATHHALYAQGRPLNRTHLWFSLLCLMVSGHVLAQAGGYQAESAQEIVSWRRLDITFAALIFASFPWFVREYTDLRPIRVPLLVSVLMLVFVPLNMLLPHGVAYHAPPTMAYYVLPWGEQIADLRVRPQGSVLTAAFLAAFTSMAYGLYAGVQQYRRGERIRARRLLVAVALFASLVQINFLINLGLVDFIYVGGFGFLALILLMHRALDAERRTAHEYMKALIDHVPALVYVKDAKGRYLLVNRPFEQAFQVSWHAVVGRGDEALVQPSDAEGLRANDRQVLDSGDPVELEETINIGGRNRRFSTLKFPILNVDRKPMAVGGISTDVSAVSELEVEVGTLRSQVRHADRVARVSALGTSLAHELRQPLAAILANAEAGLRLLARAPPDAEECEAILRDIVRDNGRAIEIIDGLRDMLRQGDAGRSRISLADTVDQVLDYVQGEMRLRGVACERTLDPSCFVLADRVQIGQVVLNLVMNAFDAMEDSPADEKRLDVSVTRVGGGQTAVLVRDSGTGLPDGDPDRIFQSFFSTKNRGLGMGLALSRSIIESHGGHIRAENNPDQGATLRFVLPLAVGGRA